MADEARWPPSPCERVINEEGDICADAASYCPEAHAYICPQHEREVHKTADRRTGPRNEPKVLRPYE